MGCVAASCSVLGLFQVQPFVNESPPRVAVRNEAQMPRLEPQTGMTIISPNPTHQVYGIYNLANVAPPRLIQYSNNSQVSTL